jgi:hypothetical protein
VVPFVPFQTKWVGAMVGLSVGAVDRRADVMVITDFSDELLSDWYQEGPDSGTAKMFLVNGGIEVMERVEVTATLGLRMGQRAIHTERFIEKSLISQDDASVGSTSFVFGAAVRYAVAPDHLVEPFVHAAVELAAFDRYHINAGDVSYPAPPGGVVPAISFGGGAKYPVSDQLLLTAMSTFSMHLGERSGLISDGEETERSPAFSGGGATTITVTVGPEYRF